MSNIVRSYNQNQKAQVNLFTKKIKVLLNKKPPNLNLHRGELPSGHTLKMKATITLEGQVGQKEVITMDFPGMIMIENSAVITMKRSVKTNSNRSRSKFKLLIGLFWFWEFFFAQIAGGNAGLSFVN